jgi:small neutral amino acid transporter SnatA (MarC family)
MGGDPLNSVVLGKGDTSEIASTDLGTGGAYVSGEQIRTRILAEGDEIWLYSLNNLIPLCAGACLISSLIIRSRNIGSYSIAFVAALVPFVILGVFVLSYVRGSLSAIGIGVYGTVVGFIITGLGIRRMVDGF